jgi:hypothetical protein
MARIEITNRSPFFLYFYGGKEVVPAGRDCFWMKSSGTDTDVNAMVYAIVLMPDYARMRLIKIDHINTHDLEVHFNIWGIDVNDRT